MSTVYDKYEIVIGLEVHMQLMTQTKAYCGDSAEYGEEPNTLISPISLGYPGTLPKLNEKVVEYAVRLGIATESTINPENKFARKNYFYADLPKGYQITQFDTPICTNGRVKIVTDGVEKMIGITRIHMEEDAGKSMHDIDPYNSLVDLNRAGVALLEMVTEPDFRSSDEAYQYLTEVRKLIRYLDICDGNMEEGSMRCDANVSVRLKGAKEFGQRTEVKNMNSIRNVKRALDYEFTRQIDLIESGGKVLQETLNFNADTGETVVLRSKEDANDYRYFTEPDLPPVYVTEDYIKKVNAEMPPLPNELHKRFTQEFGLSDYDASVLTDNKEIALFFNEITQLSKNYKAAANWVQGPIKSYMNENAKRLIDTALTPNRIAELIEIIDSGLVNFSSANQNIFPILVEDSSRSPEELAKSLNLVQNSDSGEIEKIVQEILNSAPDKVEEYRSGKKGLMGFFMGNLMKQTKGKVDPKMATKLLQEKLDK